MDTPVNISLKPIGEVSNDIKEKMRHGWGQIQSTLIIRPDLAASLDGLEDFSHLIVLFWMHQATGDAPIKLHPQGREDMPLVGVFASRSPHRPNSIGMTIVRLLERKENTLRVIGLDAIDKTPVLDIKPYLPGDSVPEAQFPEWVAKLHRNEPA
ncbi:MAG: tRNA (N6-threonylcarbamoyladenosine(37)-N6)-methyltransferase TrmO [Dehalococcoidia bacterium]|nr:tRNA (N6-threonylcarbamoyladenosine(37)-N6)-methyltransferase TrmO [Dehalococcoidia bacterium]